MLSASFKLFLLYRKDRNISSFLKGQTFHHPFLALRAVWNNHPFSFSSEIQALSSSPCAVRLAETWELLSFPSGGSWEMDLFGLYFDGELVCVAPLSSCASARLPSPVRSFPRAWRRQHINVFNDQRFSSQPLCLVLIRAKTTFYIYLDERNCCKVEIRIDFSPCLSPSHDCPQWRQCPGSLLPLWSDLRPAGVSLSVHWLCRTLQRPLLFHLTCCQQLPGVLPDLCRVVSVPGQPQVHPELWGETGAGYL